MTNADAISILQTSIDLIKKYGKDWFDERDIPVFELVIDSLEKQEWIPCSERLPKKDGSYLISGKWADGKEAVGEYGYSRDDGYFRTSWNFDVLAWKPLPEPYREDGD